MEILRIIGALSMQILFFNRKLTREEHLEPSSKRVNWVTDPSRILFVLGFVCEFLCGLWEIYTCAIIYVNDLREFFVFVT